MQSKIYLVGVLVLTLSACTTYWKNPTKDFSKFAPDRLKCIQQSQYQSCYTTPGSAQTDCTPDGTRCYTTYMPSQTSCEMLTNWYAVDNCLISMGWFKTDKNGNYK